MRRIYAKLKSFFFSCLTVALTTKMLLSLHGYTDSINRYRYVLGEREMYLEPRKEYAYDVKHKHGFISKSDTFPPSNSSTDFINFSLSQGVVPGWNSRSLIRTTKKDRYTAFRQVITQSEHGDMMDLFKTFKSVCESNNLPYMMYGGSLLGAYRHFGLIPWDDDIDVLMNLSDANNLERAFRDISGFSLAAHSGQQWKLYRNSSTVNESCCSVSDTEIRHAVCQCNQWPYIDIFFFRENETHIWDSNKIYSDVYCYKKVDVFPLISFPFENFIIPVPRNIRTILDKSYNVDLCVTLHFSHRNERRAKRIHTVPCKRLFPYFPFVFESPEGNVLTRSLILANGQLYQIIFETEQ